MSFKIGNKVIYKDEPYIITLLLDNNRFLIMSYANNYLEYKVCEKDLKPYMHEKVLNRLRTNEALEEDLDIARKNHVEAEVNLEKAKKRNQKT